MPRLLAAGLEEALIRGRLSSYGTLELVVDIDSEIKSFYLATGKLNFNGMQWQPHLRESGDVDANLGADASEATVDIQNVDTLFGIEFVRIEEYLSNAVARVGRYWIDKDGGFEAHEVLLTGLITSVDPNEQNVGLKIIPDTNSGVSVGPSRHLRRLCQAPYKSFECGRPITDPFDTCDYTLNGAGGCHGRWGATEKFTRHVGMPFLDNQVFQKII